MALHEPGIDQALRYVSLWNKGAYVVWEQNDDEPLEVEIVTGILLKIEGRLEPYTIHAVLRLGARSTVHFRSWYAIVSPKPDPEDLTPWPSVSVGASARLNYGSLEIGGCRIEAHGGASSAVASESLHSMLIRLTNGVRPVLVLSFDSLEPMMIRLAPVKPANAALISKELGIWRAIHRPRLFGKLET